MNPIILSQAGSDRGTAYVTSSKIVRHGDRLYVGWLDAPPALGNLASVRLAVCDAKSGEMQRIFTLGRAYDNHCGPSLAMEPDGRLHVVIGAHHNPFLHRWSDTPAEEGSWSEPVALGPYDTYPSLIADADGNLHLVHRKMEDRWELWYRRKPRGKSWEPWVTMAVSPLPGYNHFYQSLSVGPGGALHLLFQYCYTDTGRSSDAKSRMVVHLRSGDGGATWFNEGSQCQFPLTVDTVKPIVRYPAGGISISNHVVDENDQPWFFSILPDHPRGALFRRVGEDWTIVDTSAAFGKFNFTRSRETSLSRDRAGRLHIAVGTNPDGGDATWYDLRHEIFHTVIGKDANVESCRQITKTDISACRWLPSLEQWSWARPDESCATTPALIYTSGLNGARDGGNRNALKTEIHLLPGLSDRPK